MRYKKKNSKRTVNLNPLRFLFLFFSSCRLTMRLPSKLLDDLRRSARNLAQEEDDRMHLN